VHEIRQIALTVAALLILAALAVASQPATGRRRRKRITASAQSICRAMMPMIPGVFTGMKRSR
jgi:hypothetical protein